MIILGFRGTLYRHNQDSYRRILATSQASVLCPPFAVSRSRLGKSTSTRIACGLLSSKGLLRCSAKDRVNEDESRATSTCESLSGLFSSSDV